MPCQEKKQTEQRLDQREEEYADDLLELAACLWLVRARRGRGGGGVMVGAEVGMVHLARDNLDSRDPARFF